jgi:hypothetical protein
MLREAEKLLKKPKPIRKPRKKTQREIFEMPKKKKNRPRY